MKKLSSLLLVLSLCLGLAACGSAGNSDNESTQPQTSSSAAEEESSAEPTETEESTDKQTRGQADIPAEAPPAETTGTEETSGGQPDGPTNTQTDESADGEKPSILVAYFSRTGENYNVGHIEKGNTHIVADMIAEQVGGDLFEISTVTAYPDDYDECTEIASQEQRENARPELAASVENMADYDVIFLGYPIWWGDMPMAVYTFLESYDFSGKTIVPFCTHEGSGLSSTVRSITSACSGAEVLDGLSIRGSVAQNSQDEARTSVTSWLRELGLIDG